MSNETIMAAHLATIDAVIASTDRPCVTVEHPRHQLCITVSAERAAEALRNAESTIIEPGGFAVVPVPPADPVTTFVQTYPSSLPNYADRTTARAVTPYTQELRAEDYKAIRDAAVFAAALAMRAVIEHRSIDLVARPSMPPATQEELTRSLALLVEDGIDAACHDWLWDYLPTPTVD